MSLRILLFLCLLVKSCFCDIYLHNPRGSNNRLNEANREVRVDTRLFDSENNNRGGYNVGNVYYTVGSKLQIEWTSQHSCMDENNHCDIILQYMCSSNLRDGAVVSRIPEVNSACRNKDCSKDLTYGMHEDYEYYLQCKTRRRNYGLFVADQNLRGRGRAINTRQNPGGTRYGYECPEERDYYPYWYASPWKDIAILTNNAKRCKYFRQESQNVKSRWECRAPVSVLQSLLGRNKVLPTTKSECENDVINGTWTETKAHGIPPPECREPQWTRDNQLGNTVSGYSPSFNWTIPAGENENNLCSLRIRYNISTSDYNGWQTFAGGPKSNFSSKFGFRDENAAIARGYQLKNNPTVKVFSGDVGKNLELQLAVNTAQFGRTFQDRSHGFFIKPSSVPGVVHNVNVRGKRGNIVQVYPSVEYDFVPNTLDLTVGDHVHFQWTGSNNNNNNNDGQGRAGSDRNNVLLQASSAFPQNGPPYKFPNYGHWGRSYPEIVENTVNTTLLGLSATDLEKLAFSGTAMGDVQELDDAGTYFDLGPRKVTRTGVTHYMCTRNNNFSNRSQKGRLMCGISRIHYYEIGINGGIYSINNGALFISAPENLFRSPSTVRVESFTPEYGTELLRDKGVEPPSGDGYASNFILVGFSEKIPGKIDLKMKVTTSKSLSVYRGNPDSLATWERLDFKQEDDKMITFATEKGGIFVARYHDKSAVPLIVGMIFLSLIIIAAVGLLIYFERQRGILSNFFNNFSQNFRSKV